MSDMDVRELCTNPDHKGSRYYVGTLTGSHFGCDACESVAQAVAAS